MEVNRQNKSIGKMIELKTFYEQAQKLRIAQLRRDELFGQIKFEQRTALRDAIKITVRLEVAFDKTLGELATQLRIAPEQLNADHNFREQLEASLKGWQEELEMIRNELIGQALTDAKAGEESNRYKALEKREKDLMEAIADADKKLGRVAGRVAQAGFGNIKGTVDEIVNNAKQ